MDFGALVSLNTKPSGEKEWKELSKKYPLSGCQWLKTCGTLEIQKKKKKLIFPSKDAQIRVVLHENHRIYYSSVKQDYQPFTLPPTQSNVRHFIQEYFRTEYGLELSVRPVHDKYFENDQPYVVCNAQVQKGGALFVKYRKEN